MDGINLNDGEWAWSEERAELFKALALAQGEIQMAEKDARNPHLNSRYADLASVWKACRKPLAAHELAVLQIPVNTTPDEITLHTILTHASGQWVRGTLRMRPAKVDPQSMGSVITYARRYMLSAMVGIAPDDDDDGNQASQPAPPGQRQPRAQQPPASRQQPTTQQASPPRAEEARKTAPQPLPAADPQPAATPAQPAAAPPATPQIPGQRIPLLHKQSLEEGLFTRDELRKWMADQGAGSLGQVTPAIADEWEAELGRRRAARQQPADDEMDLRF